MRLINKIFLLFTLTACSASLSLSSKGLENQGEAIMNVQPITLEQFNDPEFMFKVGGRFDVDLFNKKKGSGGVVDTYEFVRSDGITIKQESISGEFVDAWTKKDSPFVYEHSYNADGILEKIGVRFCGFYIEHTDTLNTEGKTIKSVDMYKDIKIHINDLRKIVQKELDVDVFDKSKMQNLTPHRYGKPLRPYYELALYNPSDHAYIDKYLIDGETGEILFMVKNLNLRQMQRGDYRLKPSLYEQYKESLK